MFKILLLLSYTAFGLPQHGTLELMPDVDRPDITSCAMLLSSEEYSVIRDTVINNIKDHYGITDIVILKEDCSYDKGI